MTFAHVISGPLDLLIELGLPLAIFAGLYWWSTRRGRASAERAAPPGADKTKSRRDRG